MYFDSIKIAQGSQLKNVIIPNAETPPQNINDAELFFKTSEAKIYVQENNVVTEVKVDSATATAAAAVPKITSVVITDSSYNSLDDTAVSTDGGYIKVIGTDFSSGCTLTINNQSVSTTRVNDTELRASVPANSAGTYGLAATNPDGGIGFYLDGLTYSAMPSWSTSATLPIQYSGQAVSIQLNASQSPTYSLVNGSVLPPGLSLSSSGLISGTVTIQASTTYSFSVKATDAQNQDTTRTFSMKVSTLSIDTVSVVNSSLISIDDTAVDIAGGYVKITGTGFESGCTVFAGVTSATTVTFVSSTEIYASFPAKSAGTYSLTVTNPAGDTKTKSNAIAFSGPPVWVTGSTLTSQINGVAISIQLSATSATSYALKTGSSLPSGLSLSSSGLISGTVTGLSSTTTYSFTVIATDAENQDVERTFSLTVSTISLSSVRITDSSFSDINDTAVSTTGGYIRVIGTSLVNGCTATIGGISATVAFVNSTEIRITVPAFSAGTYSLTVTNPGGDAATLTNSISVSPVPVWVTAAVLSTQTEDVAFSIQLEATNATSYTSGNLPAGVTLSSSGLLSGTVTGISSDQTYYFTVTATDAENQDADRTFTLNVSAYVEPPSTQIPISTDKLTSLLLKTANVNGAVSTSFEDFSSFNNPISRVGNASESSFGPFSNTSWSTYFNGTSDYLTTNVSLPTNNGTVELWFYVENGLTYSSTSTSNYFCRLISGVATGGLEMSVQSTNKSTTVPSIISVGAYGASGSFGMAATGLTIPVNTWHHLAFVRSGSDNALFFNGNKVATYSNSYTFANTPAHIGGSASAAAGWLGYFGGYISNIRVVNGTAVYDVSAANIPVPTAPLTPIENTTLIACSSVINADLSSTRATITPVSGARVSNFSPFKQFYTTKDPSADGSYYFDGSTNYVTTPASANLALPSNSDWTLETWVYSTASAAMTIFFISSGASNSWVSSHNIAVYLSATQKITLEWATGAASPPNVTGNLSASLNSWNHIAVVYNGTTKTITTYLNGATDLNAYSISSYSPPAASPRITFGRTDAVVSTPAYLLSGYMKDARVVVGSRVYTSSFIPSSSALKAITGTRLLTFTSNPLKDLSSNNFALTLAGNLRYSTLSPYLQISSGASYYFNGTGDYLTAAVSATLGTNDFTFECWVYPTAAFTSTTRFFHLGPAAGSNYLAVYFNASGNIIYARSGVSVTITSTATVPLNKWTHIAVSRASGVSTVYINGVAAGTATDTYSWPAASNAFIGTDGQSNFFTGYVSNLRLVSGSAVYTSNFTPPTSDLNQITGTRLLLNTVAFKDSSSNNFTVTASGNTKGVYSGPFTLPDNTFANPNSGNSVYFDGTGDYLTVPNNAAHSFGSTPFTVEGWLRTPNATGPMGIIGNFQLNVNGWRIILNVNKVNYYQSNGASVSSTNSVVNNAWNHFAVVGDGTNIRVFLNGIMSSGTAAQSSTITSGGYLSIGKNSDDSGGTTWVYNGYLSNVRILKGTALYTSNFTVPTAQLTAISNTTLLTCQNTTVKDNSTNNFTITSYGDSIPSTFGPFESDVISGSYAPALAEGSFYFDGNGDSVSIPSSSAFAFGTQNFTIECWAYFDGTQSQPWIFNRWESSTNPDTNSQFAIFINASNYITAAIAHNNSVSQFTISDTTAIITYRWYHIAVVRNSSTVTLYVNGKSVASSSAIGSNTVNGSTLTTLIGQRRGNVNYFKGYVSDARIVIGTAVYTSDFNPPSASLTAISGTVLLTGQSGGFKDNSTTASVLTLSGDTRTVGVTPYDVAYTARSVYFDGTGDYLTVPHSTALTMGNSNFTIECWIYPVANGNGAIFSKRASSTSFSGPNLDLTSTFAPRLLVATSAAGGWAINASSTVACVRNTWNHVALVRSGTSIYIFVNGVLGSTSTFSGTIYDDAANFTIGARCADGFTPISSSYISNLRVIKGTALYTSAFIPPTSPLTAVDSTTLLTCQSIRNVDNSTNNATITSFGDASTREFSPFNIAAKNTYGGSVYFDGTGDYLSAPGSTSFGFGTGNFTIECWVYPTANPTNGIGTMFEFRTGITSTATCMRINSSRQLMVYNGPSNIETAFTSVTVPLNTWSHIAYVRNGTSVSAYINGVSAGTAVTISSDLGTTQPLYIGTNQTAGYNFNGFISDVRIIKGTALYTANFAPPTAPLPAVPGTSVLVSGSTAGIYDATRQNAIETFGNAAVSTTITKNGVNSIYFDGAGDYLSIPANSNLVFASSDFTIEFWVYFLNGSENAVRGIYSSYPNNTWGANSLFIGKNSNASLGGKMSVWIGNYSTSNGLLSDPTLPASNTWIHYAVTRSGNTFNLWKNGASVASATFSGVVNTSNSTIIGAPADLASLSANNHYGYITDLRVVKGKAIYTSAFTPPTSALTI